MRFNELITYLNKGNAKLIEFHIGDNPEIFSGGSIDKALPEQVSFLEKGSPYKKELSVSKAGVILLPKEEELISIAKQKGISWAAFKDPRLAFAETLTLLTPKNTAPKEIHPKAIIKEGVQIGKNVSIGANAYVGENSIIGSDCIIHPGVVIYEKVSISKGSELHANCVIHPSTAIGENCVIHSNAVVGSEGFGFVPTSNGWFKMPQTGVVVIEDYVEIGCNSTIDRPAVGETRIGAGTKIDNLVQIGHGVITGKGCAMASQVGIAGGAQLGDGVILAGQVGVGNRVKVGDGVIASSKCGIHADIQPGEVVSGFPAISNRLWLRCSSHFKNLPEIAKALKEIKRHTSQ